MAQQLSAQISVETGNSAARLDILRQRMQRLQDIAVKAGAGTDKFNRSLKAIQSTGREIAQIEKFNSSVGNGVTNSTGKATQALTNFNRVIQDAPFGIIGIANNIDPLIQSFQSLSQSTGGVGGALKALGASLLGPGGILFAFSALSSGAIVLTQKYGSLTAGIDAVLGLTTPLEQAQRRLSDSFNEAAASAAGEQSRLEALLSIARNKELSDKARQQAINAINKEYGEYLPNITLENVLTKEVTDATERLNKALVRKAKITAAQDLISEETKKRLKAENTALKEQAGTIETLGSAAAQALLPVAGLFTASQTVKGFKNQQAAIKEAKDAIDEYEKSLKRLLTEEAIEGTLSVDPKIKKEKVAKDLEKEFKAAIVERPIETVTLPVSKLEIATGNLQSLNKSIEQSINTQLATQTFELTPNVKLIPKVDTKELDRLNRSIQDILRRSAEDAFAGFGESIGNAIANGTSILKGAAKSILGAFGDLIIGIGKAMIKAGVALLPIQKLLKSGIINNPALAIGLGAAAVALGTIVKASIPEFANGGIVTGPTLGLIGEAGQPEVILPLSKLNTLFDGQQSAGGTLQAVVSGDSLRFILNRTDRRQGRLL